MHVAALDPHCSLVTLLRCSLLTGLLRLGCRGGGSRLAGNGRRTFGGYFKSEHNFKLAAGRYK
ncbi:hypothetical protein PR003_g7328 [Phytophthora rubi]|uniref:Uncharacterized protein n=1 Tax=Phytophthora rubi TaxID=129364 RepID=A0A6A3MXE0_9STRA|nr:hypothetical protein PR002_g7263 [Phytophthora rubi]KAE9040954.1 hypothetical protein PR001_g6840 [Phytophthora rubi]KAE9346631.1 hypothetical protein PR003_g7328 [Phytophthora rubi]